MAMCMKICCGYIVFQAGIIGNRNYNKWRETGVAYEIREGNYNVSNRTLASGMILKHVSRAIIYKYKV